MRKPPEGPPPIVPDKPERGSDYVTQERRYELITPLFGGGVEAGVNDPVTIIRGASIRGQLRFWWRATRGGACNGNLEAMKKREDAIWGAAATKDGGGPSRVQIRVQVPDKGKGVEDHPFVVVPKKNKPKEPQAQPRPGSAAHPYAAFPLQPSDKEMKEGGIGMPTRTVRVGVTFTLSITFPEQERDEVEAALWAWETFGGIGARTRRGFGALRLTKVDDQPYTDLPPANPQKAQAWLREKLAQHVVEGTWRDNVPHLGKDMTLSLPSAKRFEGDALKVWEELIKKLQSFRQQRRNKHTDKLDPYGHSDWPEPNAIRRSFSGSARGPHAHHIIDKFPRAQFGLPIIFHMPHDLYIPEVLLQGAEQDRLASPLILKPLACKNDKALGLALLLVGSQLPTPLVLKDKGNVDSTLTQTEAMQIPPLNGNPDVLQAFLDYLTK